MQSLVSVCASFDEATKTVEDLKHAGYTDNQVELINRDEIINNHIYIKHNDRLETLEIVACIAVGLVFGLLLSTGIVTLPGEHLSHTNGFVVGMAIGIATGFLTGVVLASLTYVLTEKLNAAKYEHLLTNGKYLVFVVGNQEQITHAEKIAHNEGVQWAFS